MEDKSGVCQVAIEADDVQEDEDVEVTEAKAQPEAARSRPAWSNGQCVLAMPSCSALNPSFDLSLCCSSLERDGFQIPVADVEASLRTALHVPAVRRYMVFSSALFHLIMAPMLYVLMWCAVFSTLHVYMTVTDYWVLCLSVSLLSIFLTMAIIFVLHHNNKQISMNLDVRLIQVNERLVKHKLLVAVADWVQNCTGHMQLYFVYWDMARCLRTLTETLEERSAAAAGAQSKLRRKMSHLVLAAEVPADDPEVGGPDVEQDADEQRPLLGAEGQDGGASSGQQRGAKVTKSYSLMPDASLPAQAKAHQLLMTYSATYVKQLVSERLSGSSHHRVRARRNHCAIAPFCLCQYIRTKVLR